MSLPEGLSRENRTIIREAFSLWRKNYTINFLQKLVRKIRLNFREEKIS